MRLPYRVLTAAVLACLARPCLAEETKPVTVTTKDNDGKVTLTKGQELVVRLDYTAGTGYTWQVAMNDGKELKQVGKPVVEKPKQPRPGARSHQVFKFKAQAPGTSTLELNYLRPFEKNKPPAKTFKVKVTVKE